MDRIHHEGNYGPVGRQSSHHHRIPPTRGERYDEDLHHRGRQGSDHHRGRNSVGRRRQRPAFDEELQELYGVVGEAMNFYGSFLQSFQRDVQYVKPYARIELLDHLWMCKVGASNKQRPSAGGTRGGGGGRGDRDEYRDHGGPMAESSAASFQEMARLLLEHVELTIEAAATARQSRDGENASHVYSKLGRTIKELSRHLKHAPMRAKDTEILMTELQMLATFLTANGADRGAQAEVGGYHEQPSGGQDFDEQGGGGGFQEGFDEGQGMLATQLHCFND